MSTAIVGAGAAGLSLALMLDDDVTIFEKLDRPGGLCRSTVVDGFTFDTGPHILGGIPEAVAWIRESTGIEFVEGRTRNVGWHAGEYVPHPFQDEIVGRRYMQKMWKTDLEHLSLSGLGAQPGRKPGGVSTFLYPKTGGYQAITDAWAARLNIWYDFTADVDKTGEFGRVVWTAPRPARRYNHLALVTYGYEGTAPDLTAIYLPGSWTPFHRVSFPSAFAPSNAPDGCYSIQAELSTDGLTHPYLAGVLERTVAVLGIARGEPVFRHFDTIPDAYPVPTTIDSRNADHATYYHGRTGGFRYINVDGVVKASMDLAAKLNGVA